MAGPSVSYGTAGNVVASGSLAAGASTTGVNVDFNSGGAFGGDITLKMSTGTGVAATNGCRIDIFAGGDVTPTFDTVPAFSYTFSGLAVSTTYQKTIRVPTGVYRVVATNLDATYSVTVQITSSKLS